MMCFEFSDRRDYQGLRSRDRLPWPSFYRK